MFCNHCGKSNPKNALYCNSCGEKVIANDRNSTKKNEQKTNKAPIKAFLSLLFGILSFVFILHSFFLTVLSSILGLFFGIVEINEGNNSGKGIARVGMIISILPIIFLVLFSL